MRPFRIAHGEALLDPASRPHHGCATTPKDRMLAAQVQLESLTVVTNDAAFEEFPVPVPW